MEPYNRDEYDSEEHYRRHDDERYGHHRPPPPPRDRPFEDEDCPDEDFRPGYGGGDEDFRPPPPPPEQGERHHFADYNPFHRTHKEATAEAEPEADYSHKSSPHKESTIVNLPHGQLVRIFCKGDSSFNLAVERDMVMMSAMKTDDEAQLWIKDASLGVHVKDNYGYPAFSLINKKTKKVLKHSKEKGQEVLLIDYSPDIKDDDILWTESQDFGEGFKTVRCASDTLLNLTIFEGHKRIRNGSALVLDSWHKADHQQWRISAV